MIIRSVVWHVLIDCLNKFEYCILRNYSELPYTSNDIDIMLHHEQKEKFEISLISSFKEVDVIFIRKTLYVCDSLYFFDKITFDFIHIDVFTSHSIRFLVFITGNEILNSRQLYKGIYIPSGLYEFLDLLLTRFLYTKKIKDKYIPQILNLYNSHRNEINQYISSFFGKKISTKLEKSIINADFTGFEKSYWFIITKLILKKNSNPFYLTWNIMLFINRSIKKIMKPTGRIVFINDWTNELENYLTLISNSFLGSVHIIKNSKMGLLFLFPKVYYYLVKNKLIIIPMDGLKTGFILLNNYSMILKNIKIHKNQNTKLSEEQINEMILFLSIPNPYEVKT